MAQPAPLTVKMFTVACWLMPLAPALALIPPHKLALNPLSTATRKVGSARKMKISFLSSAGQFKRLSKVATWQQAGRFVVSLPATCQEKKSGPAMSRVGSKVPKGASKHKAPALRFRQGGRKSFKINDLQLRAPRADVTR